VGRVVNKPRAELISCERIGLDDGKLHAFVVRVAALVSEASFIYPHFENKKKASNQPLFTMI